MAAAIDRLLRDRTAEPAITGALSDALPAGSRLHGLEERMKSPSSTADKIARKGRNDAPATVVSRFTDTLRYTVVSPDAGSLVATTIEVANTLTARGMVLTEAYETYQDGEQYKGIHVLVRTNEGTIFELQFHSEESQAVKDAIHGQYEIARGLASTDAEKAAAKEECRRLSANLTAPPGLRELDRVGGQTLLHRRP